jgi:hypothetical protein
MKVISKSKSRNSWALSFFRSWPGFLGIMVIEAISQKSIYEMTHSTYYGGFAECRTIYCGEKLPWEVCENSVQSGACNVL